MALARVNTTSGTADTGATTLPATAANHTTGNLIAVAVFWSNNVNANVPTDTAGNTYASTGFKASFGTSDHVEVFYAKNITGNASNVVTANYSASAAFRRVIVHQYSGADTTAPFTAGEGNQATVNPGTSLATSAWTTATADEVLFGGIGGNLSFTSLVGTSGKTKIVDLSDCASEDQIVSSTGSYTASFSWSNSVTAWLSGSSFSAPAAAAAVIPDIVMAPIR